jgi:D-3-phosphoglycerate dehydrogenase
MNPLEGTKVLVGPSSFGALDRTPMERLVSAGFTVLDNPYKRKLTRDELLHLLSVDVAGLIAGLEPLDRDVLQQSRLKVISRVGSGLSKSSIPLTVLPLQWRN